jgi:hypothetical protein
MVAVRQIRTSLVVVLVVAMAALPGWAATPTASYDLVFEASWSAQRHPAMFPDGPHFSGLIGATHNAQVSFWAAGQVATVGIESMAELGATFDLSTEVNAAITQGMADALVEGDGIGLSPGTVVLSFSATQSHSQLTLVSMIAPSPDWFIGVAGFELMSGNDWINSTSIELFAYDAGTDGGADYVAADADMNPPDPIMMIDGAPFNGVSVGTFRLTRTDVAAPVVLLSSVLPSGRSVAVGQVATAFATIINTGTEAGSNCGVAPVTPVSGNFSFQITDAQNQAAGSPGNGASIPGSGASQSYVFAFTPDAPLAPIDIELQFACDNLTAAASVSGLNTLLLSASATPVPDIVALAATLDNDGIVKLADSGAFAVATVNLGATGEIRVSADTGAMNLPLTLMLCQTNPLSGQCMAAPTDAAIGVSLSIGANTTPTFAIFATASQSIDLDPAAARVYLRFRDADGIVRGSTSVAVQTSE